MHRKYTTKVGLGKKWILSTSPYNAVLLNPWTPALPILVLRGISSIKKQIKWEVPKVEKVSMCGVLKIADVSDMD